LRQVMSSSPSIHLRPLSISHAQDGAPFTHIHHDHIGWVGGGTENMAHLRYSFNLVEDIDREETLPQENDEGMPGADQLALCLASSIIASSVPLQRIRHFPEASQNANPNLIPGTLVTRASWISSTVFMKWIDPG
jgi:hypothetical protein